MVRIMKFHNHRVHCQNMIINQSNMDCQPMKNKKSYSLWFWCKYSFQSDHGRIRALWKPLLRLLSLSLPWPLPWRITSSLHWQSRQSLSSDIFGPRAALHLIIRYPLFHLAVFEKLKLWITSSPSDWRRSFALNIIEWLLISVSTCRILSFCFLVV